MIFKSSSIEKNLIVLPIVFSYFAKTTTKPMHSDDKEMVDDYQKKNKNKNYEKLKGIK